MPKFLMHTVLLCTHVVMLYTVFFAFLSLLIIIMLLDTLVTRAFSCQSTFHTTVAVHTLVHSGAKCGAIQD